MIFNLHLWRLLEVEEVEEEEAGNHASDEAGILHTEDMHQGLAQRRKNLPCYKNILILKKITQTVSKHFSIGLTKLQPHSQSYIKK